MRKIGVKKLLFLLAQALEPLDKFRIMDKLRSELRNRRVISEIEKLESAPPIVFQWPANIRRPYIGLVKSETNYNSYWPKFERFLKVNQIPYDFLDIKRSSFITESKKFDIIIWRTMSNYFERWEAIDKIEFLQQFLGKTVLPSKEALWFYEDKIREQWLFELYHLPSLKTFISHSKEEVEYYINSAKFPFVSKDKTCSSSEGVTLVKNIKQAQKMARRIFSHGLKLHELYIRQKNYVLFQEFVPNKGFDLRIIIVGNSYFGYYRYPKKGDFRASGSGIVVKKEIPLDALLLAKKVRSLLPKTYLLSVDFLQDSRDECFYIIETSIFISIETCEQLVVNGVAGRYVEIDDKFTFETGRFWLQELMMQELMVDWINKNKA